RRPSGRRPGRSRDHSHRLRAGGRSVVVAGEIGLGSVVGGRGAVPVDRPVVRRCPPWPERMEPIRRSGGPSLAMDLNRLIAALSEPGAYPDRVGRVEVRHTHISVVFLADAYVYKIKKPVDLGFVDFSTLEKRRHFCEEEVRLNRRLAPEVYLGVVPI